MMTIFEPIFILLVLITAGTLMTAGVLALRGRFSRALRILRRLAIGAAVYMAIVVAVSALTPRGVYHIGDQRCFDDWCITVEKAVRDTPSSYEVSLRLASRARRVPQGEKGTVMYLIDSLGRRFDPVESHVPFDYQLEPGASLVATRRYSVPPDAHGINLIYTHEGGFPIGWFIVGENHWIHGPAVVPVD